MSKILQKYPVVGFKQAGARKYETHTNKFVLYQIWFCSIYLSLPMYLHKRAFTSNKYKLLIDISICWI